MDKHRYLLCCAHEFVQVIVDKKIKEKKLQNQTYINTAFPNAIKHECTKALVSIDDAPKRNIPTHIFNTGCIAGSSWPRKAIQTLVDAYKEEFLNPNICLESWKRVAKQVNQHGHVVNISVCQLKMTNLFLFHLAVNLNKQKIEPDSEEAYGYQLIEALLPQPQTTNTESSTVPPKKPKKETATTVNEQDPKPGCSAWLN